MERWQQQWRNRWSDTHVWWIKTGRDTSGGWGGKRDCWIFKRVHLKGPHGLRTYANPSTLIFTSKATVGRMLVAYGKWVK